MSSDPLTDDSEAFLVLPDAGRCSNGCRRHAAMKPLLVAVGWLAAAVGSLLVAALPLDSEESVCGIWGCFPPLQALAALHLLWCVAIGAMVCSIRKWRPVLLLPGGFFLFLVVVVTAAVVIGKDLHDWYDKVPSKYRVFWPKRIDYTLATLTDVPLVQSLLAALVCIYLGRRRASSAKMGRFADRGSVESGASNRLWHHTVGG